jgi:dihydroneopterin aldolase
MKIIAHGQTSKMRRLAMLNSCMFRVFIERLELTGFHGVAPEERKLGNRFVFDIDMAVEGKADITDDISDTVEYGKVCELVKTISDSSCFLTVEALAAAVAGGILAGFPQAKEVEVRCAKQLPPIPLNVQSAGAIVRRSQRA